METTVEKRKSNKYPIFQMRFHQLRGEMSQEEFAKKLGVSRPVIGFYENGERVPDALTLKKIAEKCDKSVDWLLGLTDVEDGNPNDVAIGKGLGLSSKSIRKLRGLRQESNNGNGPGQIMEAINMLLSVDGMEDFFWPVYLFMWRAFSENAKIDVNGLAFGHDKVMLTPEQLEKILLVNMQDFMIRAREKIAVEHDSGVDAYVETLRRGEKK